MASTRGTTYPVSLPGSKQTVALSSRLCWHGRRATAPGGATGRWRGGHAVMIPRRKTPNTTRDWPRMGPWQTGNFEMEVIRDDARRIPSPSVCRPRAP